jgi:nucleotide-binding universal stress UspA family protein
MTVVVAYSNDQYGAAALDYGVEVTRASGEDLVVVNASRGDALVDARYVGPTDSDALTSRLAGLPVPAQLRQSLGPDVAEEVLAVAAEVEPRLLVVGVRRRTPLGKLIMGSVAQRLILEAPCPVVAVKPSPPAPG